MGLCIWRACRYIKEGDLRGFFCYIAFYLNNVFGRAYAGGDFGQSYWWSGTKKSRARKKNLISKIILCYGKEKLRQPSKKKGEFLRCFFSLVEFFAKKFFLCTVCPGRERPGERTHCKIDTSLS